MMPSFVNIGAYVDSHIMVDTWATVGCCAQIGENVHLSGGVDIGRVLEPFQAAPVIIENNVFSAHAVLLWKVAMWAKRLFSVQMWSLQVR